MYTCDIEEPLAGIRIQLHGKLILQYFNKIVRILYICPCIIRYLHSGFLVGCVNREFERLSRLTFKVVGY